MNIFICGGSGYLAGSLAKELSKKYNVILGTRSPNKIINYKKKIKIKKINYLSSKSLIESFKNIDIVFHLVGMSKKDSFKNKKKSVDFKKKITRNIIKAASINKCSKLIYLSSIQVYKNFHKKKYISEKSKIQNHDAYSKTHLAAEKILLKKYLNIKNIVVIRAANIFGINLINNSQEIFNNLANNFCYQAIKFNEIKVQDHSVVRNFVPLNIFIKFIKIVILKKNLSRLNLFNLGYKSLSLGNLCKLILKRYLRLYKKKCDLIFLQKYNKIATNINFYSSLKNFKYSKDVINHELDNLLKTFKKKVKYI